MCPKSQICPWIECTVDGRWPAMPLIVLYHTSRNISGLLCAVFCLWVYMRNASLVIEAGTTPPHLCMNFRRPLHGCVVNAWERRTLFREEKPLDCPVPVIWIGKPLGSRVHLGAVGMRYFVLSLALSLSLSFISHPQSHALSLSQSGTLSLKFLSELWNFISLEVFIKYWCRVVVFLLLVLDIKKRQSIEIKDLAISKAQKCIYSCVLNSELTHLVIQNSHCWVKSEIPGWNVIIFPSNN